MLNRWSYHQQLPPSSHSHGQKRHICKNAVHRLQLHHLTPSFLSKCLASWPCWAWTPPSVLIPGLETSDSLDRNQLLPHHYSEHRSRPGLCAWSIAVHDCTATYSTNHIINFADDMTIRNLTTKVTSQHTGRRCIGYQVQSQQSWLDFRRAHNIHSLLNIDGSIPLCHLVENLIWSLNTNYCT